MSDQSYTEADVTEAVAAILSFRCRHIIGPEHYGCAQACDWCCARAVLDALAAAGRLLPLEAETRTPIKPGEAVAYTFTLLPDGQPKRYAGRVTQVADDGMVTATFPQFDAPDMQVMAPAGDFVRVREIVDRPCPRCGFRQDTANHEHGCESVSEQWSAEITMASGSKHVLPAWSGRRQAESGAVSYARHYPVTAWKLMRRDAWFGPWREVSDAD